MTIFNIYYIITLQDIVRKRSSDKAVIDKRGVLNTYKERKKKMSEKEKERDKARDKDREITFEVEEHIGVIAITPTGWKKELNMVAWNGSPAKFDIRDWDDDHTHMSRGITMNKDEVKVLSELLNGLE